MSKTGITARWTASTGASLVFMVAVALVAAPVVSAAPGDGGGNDPIAGLIGGDGPGFLGGGGEGGMGGGQGVHGRAMSKGDADTYGIGLQAHGEGDKAQGRLVFGHRGAEGDEGFGGEITCLSVGDDGVVQVSGTTREGRGDEQAAGKDFAFTILTKSDPQQFSLPTLADKGTLTPCGGGDTTTVAVTRGGFRAHK